MSSTNEVYSLAIFLESEKYANEIENEIHIKHHT